MSADMNSNQACACGYSSVCGSSEQGIILCVLLCCSVKGIALYQISGGRLEKAVTGRKHGALLPQKPIRLIWEGEVGGLGILYLTPTHYTVTSRMTVH